MGGSPDDYPPIVRLPGKYETDANGYNGTFSTSRRSFVKQRRNTSVLWNEQGHEVLPFTYHLYQAIKNLLSLMNAPVMTETGIHNDPPQFPYAFNKF